ncbi:AMP-binding protein [Thermoplasma sp.]|uniref:AMP-binding protein n=1 Tax=Thermoplasma sp. TaxID=1973142 RepID=UPI00128834BD|nr:AMP-binding protein [Thermoplasma sp.]KAA8921938.1 MAG: long-chain fatty acid--CoA ligase [Thermoplasma sp.]
MAHSRINNQGLTLDKVFLKTLRTEGAGKITDGKERVSYSEFYHRMIKIAGSLHRDIGENRVVSVMDWNSINFAYLLFSVPLSGNIIHPVDVRQPPAQIISSMREAGSTHLLYSRDFEKLAAAVSSSGIIDDNGIRSMEKVMDEYGESRDDALPPQLDENRIASVLFSSGTTGKPKGVRYRHRDIVLTTWAMETNLSAFPGPARLTSSDTVFSLIPFFHLWSWGTLYISTLIGAGYVIGGRFDPKTTTEMIGSNGVTWMSMVPTMFNALTSFQEESLDRMKILIGGSAIPSGILRFASDHAIELTGIYGFTDGLAAGIGTSDIAGDLATRNADAVNSITPLVFTDFDIEGDNGELKFRAPWLPDGYFNTPEEKAYRDGWFYPGDSAEITPDGKIKIRDRIKDLIKSGGEFIPSALLEYYISDVREIGDIAVIGVKDDRWVERPVAVYRTKDGRPVPEDMIRSHLMGLASRGVIREWWIPDRFIHVESMPMTGTGKIDKKALRTIIEDRIRNIGEKT